MPFLLKIDFLRKSDQVALAKGRTIITMLASHPYVSGPGAGTIEQLGSVIDRLQLAADAAKCRDINKVRARLEVRNEFNNQFRNTARGLESWANGDLSKLQFSGYDVRQTPKKAVAPEIVGAPKLSVTHAKLEGGLDAGLSAVKGAVIFDLYICTGDPSLEGNWELYASQPLRKFKVTDRVPGVNYWLKGRCMGVAGYGPWSAVVSLRSL
jgi:hypothetical protein